MNNKIPNELNETFLEWFRQKTEEAWKSGERMDSLLNKRVPMEDWEKNLKWVGGCSESDIKKMEKKWKISFPPDYRLFLKTLFGLRKKKSPLFHNWLTDSVHIKEYQQRLIDGLLFDIQNNELWIKNWGPKPKTWALQKRKLIQLIEKTPRLIPIYEHRYLLIEPCRAHNPVFSIFQSDIILYGPTLRTYLLHEFEDILNISTADEWNQEYEKYKKNILAIPFWGDLLRHNLSKRSM